MNSSSETTTGGSHANKTGGNLEQFIENALHRHGYTLFPDHKKQLFDNRDVVGGKQYGTHIYVGKTIYETKRYVDFLVINKEKFPEGLIIECKWQQSAGSVDEKYPFLVHNIVRLAVPTIILLDGGGYKPAAKLWLLEQAGKDRALIGVWDMSEFQKQVNNGLLG